ncbi:unnamed protein product [Brassica oleracea var. botrytis]
MDPFFFDSVGLKSCELYVIASISNPILYPSSLLLWASLAQRYAKFHGFRALAFDVIDASSDSTLPLTNLVCDWVCQHLAVIERPKLSEGYAREDGHKNVRVQENSKANEAKSS